MRHAPTSVRQDVAALLEANGLDAGCDRSQVRAAVRRALHSGRQLPPLCR